MRSPTSTAPLVSPLSPVLELEMTRLLYRVVRGHHERLQVPADQVSLSAHPMLAQGRVFADWRTATKLAYKTVTNYTEAVRTVCCQGFEEFHTGAAPACRREPPYLVPINRTEIASLVQPSASRRACGASARSPTSAGASRATAGPPAPRVGPQNHLPFLSRETVV